MSQLVIVKIVTGSENRREVALLAVIIALKVKVCYLIMFNSNVPTRHPSAKTSDVDNGAVCVSTGSALVSVTTIDVVRW